MVSSSKNHMSVTKVLVKIVQVHISVGWNHTCFQATMLHNIELKAPHMVAVQIIFQGKNRESTEGYSKSIVRKNNDKFGKVLVSTSRTYASPKRTRPGVRRSKRPLSACHIRRKCSMETTQNSVKVRVRYKV